MSHMTNTPEAILFITHYEQTLAEAGVAAPTVADRRLYKAASSALGRVRRKYAGRGPLEGDQASQGQPEASTGPRGGAL